MWQGCGYGTGNIICSGGVSRSEHTHVVDVVYANMISPHYRATNRALAPWIRFDEPELAK